MFVKFPGETKCEMIKSVDLRENNELQQYTILINDRPYSNLNDKMIAYQIYEELINQLPMFGKTPFIIKQEKQKKSKTEIFCDIFKQILITSKTTCIPIYNDDDIFIGVYINYLDGREEEINTKSLNFQIEFSNFSLDGIYFRDWFDFIKSFRVKVIEPNTFFEESRDSVVYNELERKIFIGAYDVRYLIEKIIEEDKENEV